MRHLLRALGGLMLTATALAAQPPAVGTAPAPQSSAIGTAPAPQSSAIGTAPAPQSSVIGTAPAPRSSASALRRDSTTTDSAGDDEYSPWSFQQCMLGLTYGIPFKLAVAWGGGLVYEDQNGGEDICLFGAAKVGLGAARGSLGIGRSVGALGGGAGVSVGLLRTFGAPVSAARWRNYIGASVHVFPVFAFGGELGWYRRIGDDEPGLPKRTMLTWSAGFGF